MRVRVRIMVRARVRLRVRGRVLAQREWDGEPLPA